MSQALPLSPFASIKPVVSGAKPARSAGRLARYCLLVSLALVSLLAGGAVLAGQGLTLVYSGNLDGELEPCGCTEAGNLGGILRRASLLSQLREATPELVAVSSGGLLKVEGGGDRLKSDYILNGYASLAYDAIAVQWRDLAFGPEFIERDGLPWSVSNWHNASINAQQLIKRNDQTLAFFSWLNPADSPLRKMQGDHAVVTDATDGLNAALASARQAGQLTILAVDMAAEDAAKIIDLSAVDILIQRSAYEDYGDPRRLQDTLVLTPGSRGMRLGKLELSLEQGRVTDWKHEILPMPPSIPDAPSLLSWYADYNAEVKAAYLKTVELRKQQQSGESPFVGEEVCQACHADQHDTWIDSQHAIAFEDLELVNKSFDPECIACHVVGFNKPGGFVDFSVTGHLMGVQCESCHGAGREHVESQGAKPPANHGWKPQEMCAQCHTQPHSPKFDFNRYWPRIAH